MFLGVFLWAFAFLTLTRLADSFGLPALLPHANAVQLVMTLRVPFWLPTLWTSACEMGLQMVGMAAEVEESRNKGSVEHSFRSLALYAYNCIGLFTGFTPSLIGRWAWLLLLPGPYYTLRTHLDMVTSEELQRIPAVGLAEGRLMFVPLHIAAFLVLDALFPLSVRPPFSLLASRSGVNRDLRRSARRPFTRGAGSGGGWPTWALPSRP